MVFNKLNFYGRNYSREEIIQGRKLFEEKKVHDVAWFFIFLELECYTSSNLSAVYFTNRDSSPHDLYKMTLPMIFRMASRCSLLKLAKFSFNPFVHIFRLFDFFWSDWLRINWIKSSKFSNLLERFKYSSSSSPLFKVHTIQLYT